MRKKVFGRKLGRSTSTRRALFRGLITQFIANGRIVSTKAKVKAIQPDVEKLVTLAKKGDLNAKRRVFSFLGNDRLATGQLFNLVSSFSDRRGGFTRIINLKKRFGDNAEMVRFEWTEKIEKSDKKKAAAKQENKVKDKKEK